MVHIVCSHCVRAGRNITKITGCLGHGNCAGGLERGGAVPKFSESFIGGMLCGPICVKGVTCNEQEARGGRNAEGRVRIIRRSRFPICRKRRRTVVSRRS